MPFSQPMPLGRKAEPFDHSEWIYELKYDGFRALAVVEYGTCTLFSRNGHPFASFSELASRIGYGLMPRSVVMDGEIVCLDKDGRCQFNDLLFRRGDPYFVAFDLLQINGKDLRRERLIDRKHELGRITGGLSPIVYAEHIERTGIALFKKVCELDLEGILAKDGRAPYDRWQTT
jgi:bifunctional non-homologous end joining protein LigD